MALRFFMPEDRDTKETKSLVKTEEPEDRPAKPQPMYWMPTRSGFIRNPSDYS